MTKEEKQIYDRNRYKTHSEEYKARSRAYAKTHPEEKRACRKTYYWMNPEKHRAQSKTYFQTHPEDPEKHRVRNNVYSQTPNGKVVSRKKGAKRRELSFNPLNEYFEGSEGHHIDRDHIIYIPKEMHKANGHSLLKDRNMEIINGLALKFLKGKEMRLFY